MDEEETGEPNKTSINLVNGDNNPETREGSNSKPFETVVDIHDVVIVKPKGFIEEWNGERVCRICHLGSNQASQLVQLGCGCKYELGIAHTHCAEAWFKLKGNRLRRISHKKENKANLLIQRNLCLILIRFMEEWNEGRSVDSNGNASNRGWGCWREHPFCTS